MITAKILAASAEAMAAERGWYDARGNWQAYADQLPRLVDGAWNEPQQDGTLRRMNVISATLNGQTTTIVLRGSYGEWTWADGNGESAWSYAEVQS